MMFQLHTAFATELIALTAGIAFLCYLNQKEEKYAVAKIAGYFIVGATVFSMLCTLYYGIRYWEDGYFRAPQGNQMEMSMGKMGMGGKKCPMMDRMMGGAPSEGKGPETQPSKGDHEAHHPQ